jgi:hypothetical protein
VWPSSVRAAAASVTDAGRSFTHFEGRFFEVVKMVANTFAIAVLAE